MSQVVINNNAVLDTEEFWYHGFDYNATPGSRAQITTVILPGMVMCCDPEAYADDQTYQDAGSGSTNLPTGTDFGLMRLYPAKGGGTNEVRRMRNVTRPATATLACFAGIVTDVLNARKWGIQSVGAGPHWLKLAKTGEMVMARINGTVTYGQRLMPSNGSFYLVPYTGTSTDAAAVLTSLTNFSYTCATALKSGTFDGSTLVPVKLSGANTQP